MHHKSASYLATDEDARRCDDPPVFDKCVFHLVGERSAEGEKSAGGNRGGEERGSEGRREANAVRGKQRGDAQELRKTQGGETDRSRPGWRSKQLIKDLPNAPLTLEDCVLSEPYGVSMDSV